MSLSKIVNSLVSIYIGGHLLRSPIKSHSYETLRGSWEYEFKGKLNTEYREEDFSNGSTHPYLTFLASRILKTPELKEQLKLRGSLKWPRWCNSSGLFF